MASFEAGVRPREALRDGTAWPRLSLLPVQLVPSLFALLGGFFDVGRLEKYRTFY